MRLFLLRLFNKRASIQYEYKLLIKDIEADEYLDEPRFIQMKVYL